MFFCKAQVAGQQISTPPTLYAALLYQERIWSQHIEGARLITCILCS